MFRQWHKFSIYYRPESDLGGGGAPADMDIDDMTKFLSEPLAPKNDKEPDKKEVRDEPKEDEDKDHDIEIEENDTDDESEDELEEDEDAEELKEIEESLEEPTEEELELVTPVSKRQILKKYPEIFKDFPYLEKAYYREQQYTEIFAMPADAKEAAEKANVLDQFEADLMGGNTEKMLLAVKSNPRAFNKVVDNYLETLGKVDPQAQQHVLGNVVKHVIMQMVSEGHRSNNDALKNAAHIVNQFIFGSTDFVPPGKLSTDEPVKDDREREIEEKQRQWNQQRFQTSHTELMSKVNNSIKSTIEGNIDPKNSMTDYVRRNAVRDAIEQLQTQLKKDSRFNILLNKLWQASAKDDFSRDSLDKIRRAILHKAKGLMPTVIKTARNEALRGMGKRVSDASSDKDKRGPLPAGRPPSSNKKGGSSKITDPKQFPQGMTALEFMMSED